MFVMNELKTKPLPKSCDDDDQSFEEPDQVNIIHPSRVQQPPAVSAVLPSITFRQTNYDGTIKTQENDITVSGVSTDEAFFYLRLVIEGLVRKSLVLPQLQIINKEVIK